MNSLFFTLGTLLGGVAVMLGAFASHGLQDRLSESRQKTFETGVRYQFYHAMALALVGLVALFRPDTIMLSLAGWFFIAGILFFSGSLYWLALAGPRWLGPITPLGGLAFIAGWVFLAFSV